MSIVVSIHSLPGTLSASLATSDHSRREHELSIRWPVGPSLSALVNLMRDQMSLVSTPRTSIVLFQDKQTVAPNTLVQRVMRANEAERRAFAALLAPRAVVTFAVDTDIFQMVGEYSDRYGWENFVRPLGWLMQSGEINISNGWRERIATVRCPMTPF